MTDCVQCQICGSMISTDTNSEYTPCACGAIAVDGDIYCVRILGDPRNWKIIKEYECERS